MTTLFKKYGPAVVMGVLSIALPQIALAAGTDTGESTATSIQTWLSTWIQLVVLLRSWLVALCGCFT